MHEDRFGLPLTSSSAEARDAYVAGVDSVISGVAEGFAAFFAGRWSDAIGLLERALPQAVRIGGSRAQRDLVDLTLLAACLQAGRSEAAARLVERRAHLPRLLASRSWPFTAADH